MIDICSFAPKLSTVISGLKEIAAFVFLTCKFFNVTLRGESFLTATVINKIFETNSNFHVK